MKLATWAASAVGAGRHVGGETRILVSVRPRFSFPALSSLAAISQSCSLRIPASGRRCLLHRLIALAFLGPPPTPGHTDAAHKDGNPSNNLLSNLRWATHRSNQMDMRIHGTMQDGEKCCTAKLTEADVQEIRAISQREGRGSGRRLSKRYGISPAQISRIVNRHRWKYLD